MLGQEKAPFKNGSFEGNKWFRQRIVSIKSFSLVILAVLTSAMVLLLRYSRTSAASSHQQYIISTVVFLSEILKLTLSLGCLHFQTGKVLEVTLARLYREVLLNAWETLKLAIPAFLYVVQNNLWFIALSNLDAATYQVTYQLKILTTAMFSWVILGKRLTPLHWLSLCFLILGVSLVQVESSTWSANNANKSTEVQVVMKGGDILIIEGSKEKTGFPPPINEAHLKTEVSWLLGIFAVLISCISSGFSGVYFEQLVKKGTQPSLFIRNIQLGVFSITFAVIAVSSDWSSIKERGFFQGYTLTTWAVVLLQAIVGILISVTMKYADNILKGFATSLSIIICTLVSWLVFDDAAPSTQFIIGTTIVISSIVLYGFAPQSVTSSSRGSRTSLI